MTRTLIRLRSLHSLFIVAVNQGTIGPQLTAVAAYGMNFVVLATWQDVLSTMAVIAAAVALIACYVAIGYWLYVDARRRGMNGTGGVVAWFLFNFTALFIYFLVRPRGPSRPR